MQKNIFFLMSGFALTCLAPTIAASENGEGFLTEIINTQIRGETPRTLQDNAPQPGSSDTGFFTGWWPTVNVKHDSSEIAKSIEGATGAINNVSKSVNEAVKTTNATASEGLKSFERISETTNAHINEIRKTFEKSANDTNNTINNLKTSVDTASAHFKEFSDTSILHEKNARSTIKSCAFTAIGFFACCCGTKMIYDSCQEIHEKITAEKNKDAAITDILSWRDFVRPTIGLVAVGVGYTIIARQ